MIRRHILLIAGLAGTLIASPAVAQTKIKVVATISILGDLVKNVGSDRVEVTTLVGPNSDAHVYSPSPTDAKTLHDAGVVIVNGLGLEGKSNARRPLTVAHRPPREDDAGQGSAR